MRNAAQLSVRSPSVYVPLRVIRNLGYRVEPSGTPGVVTSHIFLMRELFNSLGRLRSLRDWSVIAISRQSGRLFYTSLDMCARCNGFLERRCVNLPRVPRSGWQILETIEQATFKILSGTCRLDQGFAQI
jgi:hypothetical protein